MIRIRKRIFKPKKFYHIFNRGNRKQPTFYFPSDRILFAQKLKALSIEHGILLVQYCLMDNHFHFLLRQGIDDSISKLMQRLMTSYCCYFNKRYRLIGHLFQDRFKDRLINDEKDLARTIQYIANNPVKEGYVRDISDYAWHYIDPRFEKYLLTQT